MTLFPLGSYPGLPIEDARITRGANGAMALWTKPSGLVITRAVGKMTTSCARALEDATEQMVRARPTHVALHDWEELTDYEIEARLRLTQLAVTYRNVTVSHILVRSRIIVAAVDAAQAILKNLHVHGTRTAFEAELQRHLATSSGR